MKTKLIEMPSKLQNNFFTIQFFCQLDQEIEALNNGILKLSFKETCFIQPTMIAVIGFYVDLAKNKGNQVIFMGASKQIQANIPLRTFKSSNQEVFESYLDSAFPKIDSDNSMLYVCAYLSEIFGKLAPTISCSGHYNLKEDWLFFTLMSGEPHELNHFVFHLLVEELKLTGGKIWVATQGFYYDLKETKSLNYNLTKTLMIIGFRLHTSCRN